MTKTIMESYYNSVGEGLIMGFKLPFFLSIVFFSSMYSWAEAPPDTTCEDAKAWGFVDISGKTVIDHQFMRVRGFSEGLAAAQNDKGLWGYIDRQGKWAITPRFSWVEDFKGSRACVYKSDRRVMIDSKGKQIKTPLKGCFPKEAKLVLNELKGKYGYYDLNGKLVIPLKKSDKFEYQAYFSQKFAHFNEDELKRCGLITLSGKKIYLKTQHKCYMGPVENGYSSFFIMRKIKEDGYQDVYEEKMQYGLANTKGEIIVQPKFFDMGPFIGGLSAVENSRYNWGFINRQGKLVIPHKYSFQNYDRNLDFTSDQPRFDEKGLALLIDAKREKHDGDQNWVFINKTGKHILKFKAHMATPFREGVYYRASLRESGFYNRKGQLKLNTKSFYSTHYFVQEGLIGACRIERKSQ